MSHFVLTLFSKYLGNDVLTLHSDLCSISFGSEMVCMVKGNCLSLTFPRLRKRTMWSECE